MIYFYCTKCHKKLEAVEDWIGSSCNCPVCGTELVIPNKSKEEEKKTSITVTEEKPVEKPIEEKTKNNNDQVINETKFLLDYLESSRKSACIAVIAASVIFCVMGIIMFIASEEGAKIGGVVIAVISGIAGCAGSKIVSTMYRLKRVHWILMLGIYENTKKA